MTRGVRQVGHVAKVILTVSEVQRTRAFGSGKTRQEFRECERLTRGVKEVIRKQRSRWVKHQKGEGEMESHVFAHCTYLFHILEPCVCAHAREVYQVDPSTDCSREMCVQKEVCTHPVAHTVVTTTWVRNTFKILTPGQT